MVRITHLSFGRGPTTGCLRRQKLTKWLLTTETSVLGWSSTSYTRCFFFFHHPFEQNMRIRQHGWTKSFPKFRGDKISKRYPSRNQIAPTSSRHDESRGFWSRPFVRHLYPMEGRTYGSPPAGRSRVVGTLQGPQKHGCVTPPKWSIFGEKPCEKFRTFFFEFWDTFQVCRKRFKFLFCRFTFERDLLLQCLWGDDYRIIIHFDVINIQLTSILERGKFASQSSILPRKITCPLKNSGWEIIFLLKWPLFGGHLSFQWCRHETKKSPDMILPHTSIFWLQWPMTPLYERSLADRPAAGCLLFMIRAAARFSNKMNVSHLVVDAHEEFGNRFGCGGPPFWKTSHSLERRVRRHEFQCLTPGFPITGGSGSGPLKWWSWQYGYGRLDICR